VRLAPRNFVSVDAASGTVTIARGRKRRELPLAEIGPLRHALEERRVKTGKSWTTVVFHVARSEPHPEIRIFESEDELETRRALEKRAKAWHLPYVKPTGEKRAPEELDLPVFQRLAADTAVTTALPQKEDSNLAVAWKDDGHEIRTSYRPPVDRKRILLLTIGPPLLLAFLFREPLWELVREETPAPLRVLVGLFVLLAFLPGALAAAKSWLRRSRPPVLRITAEGVRYRGKTLPLRSIEDVERIPRAVCRFVSDRRIVEVEGDFCDPSEREWLHHEIRRLVIEAGRRSP
jgi:hypothetical protein